MMALHQGLFDTFKLIHDKYVLNPEKYQDEFNEIGQQVLSVIRRYENKLCASQEGGRYGRFSTKLSEKFWEPIRIAFPKIDYVGGLI